MNDDKGRSVACLLAGIGVLLMGIAALVWALRHPPCARSVCWVSSFSGSEASAPSPSSRTYTKKLTPQEIDQIVREFREKRVHLSAQEIADSIDKELSDERMKQLGLDPAGIRAMLKKKLSEPEVRKRIESFGTEEGLRKLLTETPMTVTEESVTIKPKP